MNVVVIILDGPITPAAEAASLDCSDTTPGTRARVETVGAFLRFEGIVRRLEDGRELIALDYQTYDPMAQRELDALATGVARQHGLSSIVVRHSRGRVRVGETSFVLEVSAPHRRETLAAVTEFIDRLKQDVPIWKQPVWAH